MTERAKLSIEEVETWISNQVHVPEEAAQFEEDGEVSVELRSLAAQAALNGLQRFAKAQEPPLSIEQVLQGLSPRTTSELGKLLGTVDPEELRWNNNIKKLAYRAVEFASAVEGK